MSRHFETHRVELPVPFPLSPRALAEAAASAQDPASLALTEAIERGRHLLEARYACSECHGANLGGGTMIDSAPIGRIFGVNLTSGKGGQIAAYTGADWDRIVRHGLKPDGTPALMPSMDFAAMSDQELSDIVSYIRQLPPVDNDVPRPTLGPLGYVLMATHELRISAEEVHDHSAAHVSHPPAESEGLAFGKHLAQVCTGCHGATLAGGPIAGGDPAWPPAANLTPHANGIAEWTYEDFSRALREGKRKGGAVLRAPMSAMVPYGQKIKEAEMKAMWAYFRSLAPMASAPR